MTQVAISNHYVPQFYLRSWIDERNGKLNVYHTIRANDGQSLWSESSPKKMACRDRFYTGTAHNQDDAAIENMLHDRYEDPAAPVIAHLRKDCRYKPTSEELDCLVNYFAAQLFRTPAAYEREREIAEKTWPKVADKAVASVLKSVVTDGRVDHSKVERQQKVRERKYRQIALPSVPVRTRLVGGGVLAETLAGKSMFNDTLVRSLPRYAETCRQNTWRVICTPEGGMELITSDNPAFCLSQYRDGTYKLNGGLRQKNCVLALPVTPRVLLFSQVGATFQELDAFQTGFGEAEVQFFNRLTAENAVQFIFVKNRTLRLNMCVHKWRSSIVNPDQLRLMQEADKNWHWDNVEAERAFYSEKAGAQFTGRGIDLAV